MSRIITSTHPEVARRTAMRCKERGVRIPTFAQMRDPALIPGDVVDRLQGVGLWDVNPLNLFRITWKNDIVTGAFGGVNFLEIPECISGVPTPIVGLIGKYFPTGAHKVGAAFGCLVPRLVSGEFNPDVHKAVWPSTGNFCRGGAFDCSLLGCVPVAVLPEEMSRERFTWLKKIGAEVIATPGCESNVKEIYDKCNELRRDPVHMIFNQFEELGNPLWHYTVTGPALEEAARHERFGNRRPAAFISATGSAGTIAAGDYLKERFPGLKIVASEALQCPTLFCNGFGGHRIEGIGDKHIPWVHNVRNTDAVAAIDDEDCMRVLRLFNEPAGHEYLKFCAIPGPMHNQLPLLGISGICNLLAAIKTAKYFDLGPQDLILTVFTDSVELYSSRLEELREEAGEYTLIQAARDHAGPLDHQDTGWFRELGYRERKAIHNLKYFTWVEQQGKKTEELREQWEPEYWSSLFHQEAQHIDGMIQDFNRLAGW
jgi:cysteine synthase